MSGKPSAEASRRWVKESLKRKEQPMLMFGEGTIQAEPAVCAKAWITECVEEGKG